MTHTDKKLSVSFLVKSIFLSISKALLGFLGQAANLTASVQGGVLAMFDGKHPWYEEYSTTPSLFVLNGFLFSLMGLYDLRDCLKVSLASPYGSLLYYLP